MINIKYLELPKCITSFVMYCYDVISTIFQAFYYEGIIKLNENCIEILNEDYCHDWSLYNFTNNTISIKDEDLINFNKQLPE